MTPTVGNHQRMRILITNDDGIESPGIRWLARTAAHAGYDVVVAAPLSESSGASASMTAVVQDGKIVSEPRELAGSNRMTIWLARCFLQPAVNAHSSPFKSVMTALCGHESSVGMTRPTPFPDRVGA